MSRRDAPDRGRRQPEGLLIAAPHCRQNAAPTFAAVPHARQARYSRPATVASSTSAGVSISGWAQWRQNFRPDVTSRLQFGHCFKAPVMIAVGPPSLTTPAPSSPGGSAAEDADLYVQAVSVPEPKPIRSPSRNSRRVTTSPLTNVPLLERRSTIVAPPCGSSSKAACCLETESSSKRMSQWAGSRPMV